MENPEELSIEELLKRAGERLKNLRIKKYPDLSLREYSGTAEISRTNMYKIEEGESDPKISSFIKLARKYDIPLSALIQQLFY